METRKYNSPLGGDTSTNKANKGKGWKGLKGQAALALAVSLWIGGAGVASADGGVIYLSIDADDSDTVKVVPAEKSVPAGAFLSSGVGTTGVTSMTVKGDWTNSGTEYWAIAGWVSASGGNDIIGRSLTVDGGTNLFGVGGATSVGGNASNNTVTLKNGSSSYVVTGGDSQSKNATNNKVYLIDSKATGYVVGGTVTTSGDATGNLVSLTNSEVKGDNAQGIIGGKVSEGGNGAKGNLTNNKVSLTNSKAPNVYGGYAEAGNGDIVTGNTLDLFGTNTVTGQVTNFETINLKAAEWGKPVLTLSGTGIGAGIVQNKDDSYATIDPRDITFTGISTPWSMGAGNATNLIESNEEIKANLESVSNISHKYTVNSTNMESFVTGVEVEAAINGSVGFSADKKVLAYTITSNQASKLTFSDVEWKDSGALINHATTLSNVKFDGADVDTSNINFTNLKALKDNKEMTLVSDFGETVGTITGTKYKVGSTLEGEGKASLEGKDLIFTTGSTGLQEQTHNTVMGAEVGMAALSAGNDFVGAATEGLSMAGNTGSDGLATYANMGGGSMKVETGSHVKTRTWNAILALGHKNEKKLSTTEYGAFFEYGTGNYSTFNGDERGDGSTHYTGGGILGKWKKNNGFYVEGSLRAGSIHDDANNVLRADDGTPYSYTTNSTYWGAHIGVGKELKVNKTDLLDLYAKYFYNHRGSVSFDAEGHYDLDAVESSVLRVGTRYTVKQNDNFKYYGGLAVEHEFAGRASGTATPVGGTPLSIRGADISGTSVRGEIGATFRPGEKSNVTLDLNLSGFAGKKQGLTGGLSAVFHI